MKKLRVRYLDLKTHLYFEDNYSFKSGAVAVGMLAGQLRKLYESVHRIVLDEIVSVEEVERAQY